MEIKAWHFLLEHSVAKHVFSAHHLWQSFEGRVLSRYDLYHRERLKLYRGLFLSHLNCFVHALKQPEAKRPEWLNAGELEEMIRRSRFDWTHRNQFGEFYKWFQAEYGNKEAEFRRLNCPS